MMMMMMIMMKDEGGCQLGTEISGCESGFECAKDRCLISLGFGPGINCCTRECNSTAGNCCTNQNKCQDGEGDCFVDTNCAAGLRCGTNNCNPSLGLPDDADCCTSDPCDAVNGHGRCCTPNFKCGEGEGDCDKDSHCNDGLVCGTNNCGPGFPTGFDCCTTMTDSQSNTCQFENHNSTTNYTMDLLCDHETVVFSASDCELQTENCKDQSGNIDLFLPEVNYDTETVSCSSCDQSNNVEINSNCLAQEFQPTSVGEYEPICRVMSDQSLIYMNIDMSENSNRYLQYSNNIQVSMYEILLKISI